MVSGALMSAIASLPCDLQLTQGLDVVTNVRQGAKYWTCCQIKVTLLLVEGRLGVQAVEG